MTPDERQEATERAARALQAQVDPRGPGYSPPDVRGPTADEILARATGEPGPSFDHPYYDLAREAIKQATDRAPARASAPSPGREWVETNSGRVRPG